MFRLTRPDARDVAGFLAAQRDAPFSYAEVGATRAAPPGGYTVDHHRVRLGSGPAAFARAVDALRAWRMAALGWAVIQPPAAANAARAGPSKAAKGSRTIASRGDSPRLASQWSACVATAGHKVRAVDWPVN